MDDDFIHVLRQDPSPEFARDLKSRLNKLDTPKRRGAPGATRWLALAASLAVVTVAFTFPSVRAGAQAFLDLFRVSTFAGVAFDPTRLASLEDNGLDWPQIIGEQVEVLKEPAPPVSYATPAEAGAAAGIHVYEPTWLPRALTLVSTEVAGGTEVRFTASTVKLQLLLDSLGIDDVTVPAEVDGQKASLRTSPVVTTTYKNRIFSAVLVQSRSPEVSFPAGLDVPMLAETGLRILGLSRQEAYRFAQSIDWRTTLVVPVPVTAASFSETYVQGQKALMIETSAPTQDRPPAHVLLWSFEGNVYVLTGVLSADELLAMAQTLQ